MKPFPCPYCGVAVPMVLREDGTCWVNMGDSYAGAGRGAAAGLWNALRAEVTRHRGAPVDPLRPVGASHAAGVTKAAVGRAMKAWDAHMRALKITQLVTVDDYADAMRVALAAAQEEA